MADSWFPTRELAKWLPKAAIEALRKVQTVTNTKVQGKSVTVRSDAAGVFDANTTDLIVAFYEFGVEVATATIRGILDVGSGEWTLSNPVSTGDETSVAYFGTTASNVGDSVRADVTHLRSGVTGSAAFSAIDNSTAGSTPSTITEGGGGGDFGGGDFGGGGGGGGMKIECELVLDDFTSTRI